MYNPETLPPLLADFVKAKDTLINEIYRVKDAYDKGHGYNKYKESQFIPVGVRITEINTYTSDERPSGGNQDRVIEMISMNPEPKDDHDWFRIDKIDMFSLTQTTEEIVAYIQEVKRKDKEKEDKRKEQYKLDDIEREKKNMLSLMDKYPELALEHTKQ
jgi:hypothetical protein